MILFTGSPEKRNKEVCCTTSRLFLAAQANCRSMSIFDLSRLPVPRGAGPSLRDRPERYFRSGDRQTVVREPRRIFPALIACPNLSKLFSHKVYRNVAQPGSALPWGGRGRGFESRRSDKQMSKIAHASNEACFFFSGFNFGLGRGNG